jgi:glycosyltransferase involved in cell wall biosynthesis
MRVSIVTETYMPQVNGVSRTLRQLVRVLTEAGDAVQLIHPDYGEPAAGPHDRLVRSLTVPFYPELHLPVPPFGGVKRALDAFRPDLIHIATEATLGHAVLGYAARRRIPTVSSFHTNFDQYSGHYGLGWTRTLIWRHLRRFHNRTRETYVPSRATMTALRARGFERLVLWPRGVDAESFRPDRPGRGRVRADLGFEPHHVVIGHVSRLAVEKNVGYLAAALERVAAARPDVRLLIVGDGPARPELRARLGGAARFVGYRTGDDLADHYAAADLFAFASTTETFGNVILEAMASALPVVALRAGGPGDIVQPGVTGLLVEPDAPPDRFAAALLGLVDDADLRRPMAGAARSYAASQSWDAIMDDLRQRYRHVIESSLATALVTMD